MFFIISKILHFFLVPLNWIIVLLIISLFVSPRNAKRLIISSLILLYVYTTDFVLNILFKQIEYPLVWFKDLPNDYDAAIVLGGMAAAGKKPDDRTHFPGSPDRLLHAIQLYKLGKVKRIILSGGSGEIIGKKIPEAEYLKNVLLLCEVPDSAIFIENESRNTHENALFSKKLIQDQIKNASPKLLLITSAWHMKRSMGCFEKERLNVTAFPVDSQLPEKNLYLSSFIPNQWNPGRWQILIHEYFGFISYSLSGYL
ncbi:MAG: YdcF family protein [Opitutaceae bacterium]|nr:YdcF family protein [Cytophagales bacterium]